MGHSFTRELEREQRKQGKFGIHTMIQQTYYIVNSTSSRHQEPQANNMGSQIITDTRKEERKKGWMDANNRDKEKKKKQNA
jgi:hypothetical protein